MFWMIGWSLFRWELPVSSASAASTGAGLSGPCGPDGGAFVASRSATGLDSAGQRPDALAADGNLPDLGR